jgi:microcystin-dependent protein
MTIATGEKMLASDILDLTFFPIGSILMMDGSWTDGRGGWYICDGRNTPHGKTPNLTDRFIRGGVNAGQSYDNPTITNTQSITLTIDNLPSHSHTINDPGHKHKLPLWYTNSQGRGMSGTGTGQPETDLAYTGITINNTGGGKDFKVNTMPSYYTMIYIKKMA